MYEHIYFLKINLFWILEHKIFELIFITSLRVSTAGEATLYPSFY